MLTKRFSVLFFTLTTALCLSSCGKATDNEKEIAVFSTQVKDFTDIIKTADEQINRLDTTNINAPTELLEILDNLSIEFNNFSEISVPEQYKSIDKLADEAYFYMSQAVSYYHNAFDNESYDSQYLDTAYNNYTRAMTRVKCIGYILAGEIPDDENIEINILYDNDSKLLDKLLSDEVNTETISEEHSVPAIELTP